MTDDISGKACKRAWEALLPETRRAVPERVRKPWLAKITAYNASCTRKQARKRANRAAKVNANH